VFVIYNGWFYKEGEDQITKYDSGKVLNLTVFAPDKLINFSLHGPMKLVT